MYSVIFTSFFFWQQTLLDKVPALNLMDRGACCLVAQSCPVFCHPMEWTVARQASLSFTVSRSLLKLMSIELVTSSNRLVLCRPLLLLPSVFLSIRVFSNESALCIRWPKYWRFSLSISPSSEYSGMNSPSNEYSGICSISPSNEYSEELGKLQFPRVGGVLVTKPPRPPPPPALKELQLKTCCAQSCPTLCDPMDCSPPGSSIHGILQARILEWVAMPSSKGSSQPRDRTQVSHIAGRFFTV